MKIIIFFFFLIFNLYSDLPKYLEGTWKSNRELTMKYIDKENKLDASQKSWISQVVGRTEITFSSSSNIVKCHTPKQQFLISGNTINIPTHDFSLNYKILGVTEKQIAIEYISNIEIEIETHFHIIEIIDKDTYSIYMGNYPPLSFPAREYFKRIKKISTKQLTKP